MVILSVFLLEGFLMIVGVSTKSGSGGGGGGMLSTGEGDLRCRLLSRLAGDGVLCRLSGEADRLCLLSTGEGERLCLLSAGEGERLLRPEERWLLRFMGEGAR